MYRNLRQNDLFHTDKTVKGVCSTDNCKRHIQDSLCLIEEQYGQFSEDYLFSIEELYRMKQL
jgi:hypothetical protein